MTQERKNEIIRLLKPENSKFNKAVIFYLTRGISEYKKKTAFVERVVDAYMDVEEWHGKKYLAVKKIPNEIVKKLVQSYEDDLAKDQKPIDEALIAEMNEIF